EWGVPLHGDRELFAKLVLDGFQAGLSWRVILNKRARFLEVFDGFDPERMARYDRKKSGSCSRTRASSATARRWRPRCPTHGPFSSSRSALDRSDGFSGPSWEAYPSRTGAAVCASCPRARANPTP